MIVLKTVFIFVREKWQEVLFLFEKALYKIKLLLNIFFNNYTIEGPLKYSKWECMTIDENEIKVMIRLLSWITTQQSDAGYLDIFWLLKN